MSVSTGCKGERWGCLMRALVLRGKMGKFWRRMVMMVTKCYKGM